MREPRRRCKTVAYRVIGRQTPRVGGVEKVTGAAQYTADVSLPGTLWGKALHSPYPHARISRIDVEAARRLAGVHAVLTGADVRSGPYGRVIKDLPILAYDRVRFVGERVAAVVGEDEDVAQAALELIEVEYEELPAVFDPIEALAAAAPILHPDFDTYPGAEAVGRPTNAYHHTESVRGDPERGFAEADLVVENTYRTPKVHQAYLETQSVLVSVEGDHVQVWACGKAPYDLRRALAVAIAVPEDKITLNPVSIGGDFGGKATPADLPAAYFLSKATGRPVRMVLDYLEEFLAGNPRHSTLIQLKTGVKRDGTITAHEVRFFVDAGAYAAYKPRGIIGGANQSAGPYRVANCRIEATHVYTNTVPGGHMRAPGEPQGLFALESQIDEVAGAIGMDPLDFRLRNLVGEGDETAFGARYQGVRARETLSAAAEAAGYREPKPALSGRGIAIGDRGPGGGRGNAAVTLNPDGGVVLGTPIFEQGTGTYTTLAQVVAEELDLAPERISFEVWTTGAVDFDSGLGGARGTRVNTAVAHEAATETKRELFALAVRELGWPEESLVLRGDEVRRTDTEEAVRWPDLLSQARQSVTGRAHYGDTTRSPVTSFTAQVAEVAVDPETGEVRLLNFTTAHDVGRIVNPVGHQGQINGGFAQGLGYALMEQLVVEDGRVTSLSFADNKIPSMRDVPPLKTVLVPSENGVGPYGIKGIGESSIGPVAPAIANAIADAVGVRIRDLPLTAEKIYRALREREES